MKILILHDFSQELGGGEIHVQQLSKLLVANGLEVVMYYGAKKNSPLSAITSFFNLKHLIKLFIILRKDPAIKILHLHGTLYNLSPSIYLLKIFFDIRIIQTIHAFQYYCPRTFGIYEDGSVCEYGFNYTKCLYKNCSSYFVGRKYILWYFYKWLKILINRFFIRRFVDTFICPSRKLMEYLQRSVNLQRGQLVYLPNFIELDKIELDNDTCLDEKKILFVGRLSKLKGVHVIIKALGYLRDKENVQDITLDIVGDGPERQSLEKLTIELGVANNVTFFGTVENSKLHSFYKNSSCVILPSICLENNPLVAIEGMKSYRPLIGSNVGGFPDLIEDGKNGHLFKMGNHIDLAGKILLLYGNKEKIVEMGTYGFEKLKKEFNSEMFYEKLIELYNDEAVNEETSDKTL